MKETDQEEDIRNAEKEGIYKPELQEGYMSNTKAILLSLAFVTAFVVLLNHGDLLVKLLIDLIKAML